MPRITPNLWFDTQGLEASGFSCPVFPDFIDCTDRGGA